MQAVDGHGDVICQRNLSGDHPGKYGVHIHLVQNNKLVREWLDELTGIDDCGYDMFCNKDVGMTTRQRQRNPVL